MIDEGPKPVELLATAIGQVQAVMSGVTPAQLDNATPCAQWDVCALMNHMLGGLETTAGCMAGSPPDRNPMEADSSLTGQRDISALTDAYRKEAERLLRLAREPDALDRVVPSPFGEMPAARFVVGTVLDQTIHCWDLAKATGQDIALPAELVEYAMPVLMGGFAEGGRAMGVVGPEVAVPEGASAQDKLLGYMGRQP
ncbi:MAG: TIGR03086 family protein [Dehalococcoidia bacterium]|nr:TIGR03086 family protein [Dehalococcoidia bacterium]